MTKNLRKIILILGDVTILYISLWLALYLRYLAKPERGLFELHLLPFSLVFLFWLLVFYIDGWYELRTTHSKQKFYSILFRDTIINGLIAIAVFYFAINRITKIRPQTILVLDIIVFTVLFILWHKLFANISRSQKISNKVLIIGNLPQSQELAQEIFNNPNLGFELVGIVGVEKQNQPTLNENKVKYFTEIKNLFQIVKENKINTIVTAIDPEENPQISKVLFSCLPLKVNFYNLTSFYENISGKIPVSTIKHTWFLENLTEGHKRKYDSLKRLLDVVLSLLALIISLPFWLIITIGIKITSPGPTTYKQKRVGQGGKVFTLIKFRSMVHNAESTGAVWAQKNDSRVTKFGNFLRKTRLDEIPQFINILKGDMSLIGPRPERPEFVETLQQDIPFYKERLLIKPGLTGWAQVNFPYGASKEDAMEKLQYDLFYIKHRSIILDLSILLKTIKIVLSREGI